MVSAPLLGFVVARFGERLALIVEYGGLGAIFLLYAGLYVFDWGAGVAAALYVLNHLFFALALAIKTYFQKIATPGDIAPTAAVAFTINHIAAVFSACRSRVSLAVLAHLGLHAGGGDGGHFARTVLPCAAPPRARARDQR